MLREFVRDKPSPMQNEASLLAQAKWRALVFDKAGQSYKGIFLYPSQGACATAITALEAKLKNGEIDGVETAEGIVEFEDFHHAMPMPELA